LVVDVDLIAALKSGRVAAAGLDVFEGEPKPHAEYVSLKNTFLLLHIGSATIETRTAIGMLALDNLDALLNGRPAPTSSGPNRSSTFRRRIRTIRWGSLNKTSPTRSDASPAFKKVSQSMSPLRKTMDPSRTISHEPNHGELPDDKHESRSP
jgi:hypothetical protein